jgi:hypothetical protein
MKTFRPQTRHATYEYVLCKMPRRGNGVINDYLSKLRTTGRPVHSRRCNGGNQSSEKEEGDVLDMATFAGKERATARRAVHGRGSTGNGWYPRPGGVRPPYKP